MISFTTDAVSGSFFDFSAAGMDGGQGTENSITVGPGTSNPAISGKREIARTVAIDPVKGKTQETLERLKNFIRYQVRSFCHLADGDNPEPDFNFHDLTAHRYPGFSAPVGGVQAAWFVNKHILPEKPSERAFYLDLALGNYASLVEQCKKDYRKKNNCDLDSAMNYNLSQFHSALRAELISNMVANGDLNQELGRHKIFTQLMQGIPGEQFCGFCTGIQASRFQSDLGLISYPDKLREAVEAYIEYLSNSLKEPSN